MGEKGPCAGALDERPLPLYPKVGTGGDDPAAQGRYTMKTTAPRPIATRSLSAAIALFLTASSGCAHAFPPADRNETARSSITLVESYPVETVLDHPDIPDAFDVWPALIAGAKRTIDFAEFYASADPAGKGKLEPVILAVEKAGRRGVKIRFLLEERFHTTYPDIAERLALLPGVTVRWLDSAAFDGGVLHAKYFVIDNATVYLGSQNFDWRSLEHIQELGAVIRSVPFAGELTALYDLDWEIAGRIAPGEAKRGTKRALVDSIVMRHAAAAEKSVDTLLTEDGGWLCAAFSPEGRLVDERFFDEPRIVDLIDGAADSLRIQLLTYRPVGRKGEYYDVLENALRRAAARGVVVRLLVADWCMRRPTIDYLKSLSLVPGIEVRLMTIPEWSGGFIPFARVCHAKYMVVDRSTYWIGTSNWEKDYFHASRNVGIAGGGGTLPDRLVRFFATGWNSPYAAAIRPEVDYVAPRISSPGAGGS